MRTRLKQLADLLALALALPAVVLYHAARPLLGAGRAFTGWSQALSLVPGLSGVYFRRAFYRMVLPQFGPNACVGFSSVFSHPSARVGRNVSVGAFCSLGDVTLEDDVLLASGVSIVNGGRQHGFDRLDLPVFQQPGGWPRVTVGRDSWVGERAVVMADVGRHCVIGAGAVVTKPIPDYAIAVGVPARVVRYRENGQPAAELRQPDAEAENVPADVVR
jgi:acetyltransferase-like isoleucine patch superfamily enzyme